MSRRGGGAPGVDAAPTVSTLSVGTVRHRRHRPTVHAFGYRTYHALLDVDELPKLDATVRGFGYNRPAPFGFRDTDHLGDGDRPVREKLAAWLDAQGVTLPDGPVRVLTNLRVLGHVFDPISWWFCHHLDGSLAFVVAEVNNTFGDRTCELLELEPDERPGVRRASATKRMHVSPFLPVEGMTYRFTFVERGDRLTTHIDVDDPHGRILDATQSGRQVPLTARRLARVAVTHPLMPLRTVLAIHWQAVKLWCKRVPFHRRPSPPLDAALRPGDAVDHGGHGSDPSTATAPANLPADVQEEPVP